MVKLITEYFNYFKTETTLDYSFPPEMILVTLATILRTRHYLRCVGSFREISARRDKCRGDSWRELDSLEIDLGEMLAISARCLCLSSNLDEISLRSYRDIERHKHHGEILTISARCAVFRNLGPKFRKTAQKGQNL